MPDRPRLLDLFCGAGGAGMGYHRAGLDVTGVDIVPQPRYPFEFWQDDAIALLASPYSPVGDFDVIHASPPCQAWSHMAVLTRGQYPMLIDSVRALLAATGKAWVIENVERAPLQGMVLCGTQLGVPVRRHRRFETHPDLFGLIAPCNCRGRVASGELVGHRLRGRVGPGRTKPPARTEAERRAALGVDWMTVREARQAIPPAYTEYIGGLLIDHLNLIPNKETP